MKRTLSIVLALVMLLAMFTMVGAAQSPEAQQAEAAETGQTAPETPVEPAADEPEAGEAYTTEPAPVSAPAEGPADNGVTTAAEPPAATPELPTTAKTVEWVTLDCNGGTFQGFSKHTFDVVDGKLVPGLSWYAPTREGYKFLGWFKDKDHTGKPLESGDEIKVAPEGTTLYAGWEKLPRTVTLDAAPGSFTTEDADQNYTRTVTLTDGDKLPRVTETPVYGETGSNVKFDGWYTEPCTVGQSVGEGYWTVTITNNGTKIDEGSQVKEGITTLYAGYKVENTAKKITYYYDWNGIDGRYGQCLTATRSYSETEQGYKLTIGDLLIWSLNWSGKNSDNPGTKAELQKYWKDNQFNGYTFMGWSRDKNAKEADVWDGETIQNGETLYAVWTKDGSSSSEFERVDPEAGPIDGMHIDARHLTIRQDPVKGGSVTIPLFVTPVGGTGEITWIVEVPPTFDPNHLDTAFKGKTQKYNVNDKGEITKDEETGTTEDPKFTAKVDGLNLVITPEKGCSQVLYVSAKSSTGKETPQPATVVITHTPNSAETVTQAATCTAAGEAAILCTECGEATEVHAIPATGHSYEVVGSQVVGGVRVYTEKCSAGDAEKQIKAGDANDDGYVSLRDVSMLYNSVKGSPNAEVTKEAGDTDGDGCVSMTDVNRLFNYVRGAASTLG